MEDLDKYPYFIYPAVKALREDSPESETAVRLRRLIAANVGDIPSLRLMLGADPEEFAEFYPDLLPPSLSTTDTIDSFLSRFGNPDLPTPRAAAEIVPDVNYALPLEDDDNAGTMPETEADATSSAIDAFLSIVPPATAPKAQNTTPEGPPTQVMANILIKNHDYQKALEIIQQLILINPEKSVYFADQIRFLRKLIFNEARKNNLNSPADRTDINK